MRRVFAVFHKLVFWDDQIRYEWKLQLKANFGSKKFDKSSIAGRLGLKILWDLWNEEQFEEFGKCFSWGFEGSGSSTLMQRKLVRLSRFHLHQSSIFIRLDFKSWSHYLLQNWIFEVSNYYLRFLKFQWNPFDQLFL